MANGKAATQEFLGIKDIKDNVVIEPNGKMVTILLASSVNFALKSLDEQQAILLQFQSFLNTIDFSLQIPTASNADFAQMLLSLLGRRSAAGIDDKKLSYKIVKHHVRNVAKLTMHVYTSSSKLASVFA